ncbi:unnamed protein product [Victoria cruziana]
MPLRRVRLVFLVLCSWALLIEAGKGGSSRPTRPDPPPSPTGGGDSPNNGNGGGFQPSGWIDAHATFYGDETASETMGGACGYGNLFSAGYGTSTAALSSVLYQDGLGCGQCYEIKCDGAPACYQKSIVVTATNLCPPNWAQPSDNGGWCNPPRQHFDLAKPAFMQIAEWHAGIVPVKYRRVPCAPKGGIRFTLQGNAYWLLVYIMNVGGGGDIGEVAVKGGDTDWMKMSHNWGATYQAFSALGGQTLSFRITCLSSKQSLTLENVAPSSWQFGMTYEGALNFN